MPKSTVYKGTLEWTQPYWESTYSWTAGLRKCRARKKKTERAGDHTLAERGSRSTKAAEF
jgi:hypothetical protein